MAATNRAKLLRWKKYFKEISREVLFLNHYADVREQFNLIAAQSPVAELPSEFWRFVHQAFANEMILRIMRLSESHQHQNKKRHVYSLKAFLEEIAPNCHLLSREQYLEVKPATLEAFLKKFPNRHDDSFQFNRLNLEFDKIAGKGGVHISRSTVDHDISGLEVITKKLKAYRDKQLAHNSIKKSRYRNPKLVEIRAAIGKVHELAFKYFLVLNSAGHAFTLDDQLDITKLFLQPWIQNKTDRQVIRERFNAYLKARGLAVDDLVSKSAFAAEIRAVLKLRRP